MLWCSCISRPLLEKGWDETSCLWRYNDSDGGSGWDVSMSPDASKLCLYYKCSSDVCVSVCTVSKSMRTSSSSTLLLQASALHLGEWSSQAKSYPNTCTKQTRNKAPYSPFIILLARVAVDAFSIRVLRSKYETKRNHVIFELTLANSSRGNNI